MMSVYEIMKDILTLLVPLFIAFGLNLFVIFMMFIANKLEQYRIESLDEKYTHDSDSKKEELESIKAYYRLLNMFYRFSLLPIYLGTVVAICINFAERIKL